MTVNIQVRHSSDSDIAAIKAIYAQPSCYANTLQLPHPSIEQWQARLSGTHEHFYSLVAEVEGAVVGQLGMEVFASPRRKHVANIGMAVDENHRGQQVGEALMQQAVELANDWLAITVLSWKFIPITTLLLAYISDLALLLKVPLKRMRFVAVNLLMPT